MSLDVALSALKASTFSVSPNCSSISWNALAIVTPVCDYIYISIGQFMNVSDIPLEPQQYQAGTKTFHLDIPNEQSRP